MRRAVETLKSESFLGQDLLVFINRAAEDFTLPLHNHDFLEFAYVAEGVGFHHIGEEVHKVRKGELCYIPIGLSHVFRPVSTNLTKHPLIVYNCVFSTELLAKAAMFSADRHVQQFIAALQEGSVAYFSLTDEEEVIERLILAMHREYSLPREGSTDFLHALLLQLLIAVQRIRLGSSPALQDQPVEFAHLLNYMDRHYAEELTLARLAAISQWSERHLQRLFIRHTEQSFSRYLQSLRVQKSLGLIRSTQLKVGVIAEKVGYKDFGSFLAVFKRIVGMTPSQFRKAAVHPQM